VKLIIDEAHVIIDEAHVIIDEAHAIIIVGQYSRNEDGLVTTGTLMLVAVSGTIWT